MKAQDLRIGNLVYFNNNNIGTITEIKSSLISEPSFLIGINNRIDIYYDIDNLKFVPLTEEILLKCGFSTTDYKSGYIGIDHKAGGIITDFVLTYPLVIGEFQKHFIWEHSKFKYNELKYVHQLQNIFFALTNEELTINL
jgi:hypothetical protein